MQGGEYYSTQIILETKCDFKWSPKPIAILIFEDACYK